MKALSLWQPWASFVVVGLKRYETRSWATAYRGKLAIHGAKHWTAEERDYLWRIVREFNMSTEKGSLFQTLMTSRKPFGAMLGTVELTDCIPTVRVNNHIAGIFERAMGDFGYGRFAWQLENVQIFPEPIPTRGYQGLWEWERPEGSKGDAI